MIHSCKGCEERYPGCHSECEKYIRAKELHDAAMDRAKKEKAEQMDFLSVKIDALQNWRKKKRWL